MLGILNESSPSHIITCAVNSEQGYRYSDEIIPLHDQIEDYYFPKYYNDKYISSNGAQLFILADGHGGVGACEYIVPLLASSILKLLEKDWDLKLQDHRLSLSNEISSIFQHLDSEYNSIKIHQYKLWKDSISSNKPDDDGCTMIVNILHSGYLINCNTGDSRTLLGGKRANETNWTDCYHSIDHNTTHPSKVLSIKKNGGEFVSAANKILPFSIENHNHDEPFIQLATARIYRPSNQTIKDVGISHKRTLNLTATMGDLLFKLEPAVLSCIPDISFIPLSSDCEYIIIVCTDGVWDHLKIPHSDTKQQNNVILNHVSKVLLEELETSNLRDRLSFVAKTLVEREPIGLNYGLFSDASCRYDDATAQLIHLTSKTNHDLEF